MAPRREPNASSADREHYERLIANAREQVAMDKDLEAAQKKVHSIVSFVVIGGIILFISIWILLGVGLLILFALGRIHSSDGSDSAGFVVFCIGMIATGSAALFWLLRRGKRVKNHAENT